MGDGLMMMDDSFKAINQEVKELADQVREHYPTHPESAFEFFRSTGYPAIVSATLVSVIWGYMEYEQMMKTGMNMTRPILPDDLNIHPHMWN